jgi:hypothetical protein
MADAQEETEQETSPTWHYFVHYSKWKVCRMNEILHGKMASMNGFSLSISTFASIGKLG